MKQVLDCNIALCLIPSRGDDWAKWLADTFDCNGYVLTIEARSYGNRFVP